MRITNGNIWDYLNIADVICITTNGSWGRDGAIMGKGIALEATQYLPGIKKKLADFLQRWGNRCFVLGTVPGATVKLVSFPTKPGTQTLTRTNGDELMGFSRAVLGDNVPGWQWKSNIPLIEKSCKELTTMADKYGWKNVMLPWPGCGNGGLTPIQVKPILEAHFDDRFTVIGR